MNGQRQLSPIVWWALAWLCIVVAGLGLLVSARLGWWTVPVPATPTAEPTAHVECFYAGEKVFEFDFDQAREEANGQVQVWMGDESVVVEGDCRISTPAP